MTTSMKQKATFRSRFLPFFLNVSLIITVVYGNDENTTLLTSSAPSSIATVPSYNCGGYSTAKILTHNIMEAGNNNDNNWTAMFKAREKPPFQFLKAGISCVCNSDRMIFDNDHIKQNNAKNMSWNFRTKENNSIYNVTDNGFKNVSMDNWTGNEAIAKKGNKEIKTPDTIHIHIYAIDDHLEFKYQSYPMDMVLPKIDIIPSFEINNETYGNNNNSTNLRFVWNQNMAFGGESMEIRNTTLELWVPRWILETTIILCPQYDYSLGIEIGGTVDSGGERNDISNETASTNNNQTNIQEENDKNDLTLLLTQGPPRSLTIINSGIGTELVIDIDADSTTNYTSSSSNGKPNNNMLELKYIDQTLNSKIRIQTDQNVNGTIQMVGSNMQATIVSKNTSTGTTTNKENSQISNDGEKRSDDSNDDISIILNGFQQVVSVMGNYEEIVLGGHSIALYTTEGCSEADRVVFAGVYVACFEIDTTNMGAEHYPDESIEVAKIKEGEYTINQESGGSLYTFRDSISLINFTNATIVAGATNRKSNNPTPGGLKPLFPVVILPTCLVTTTISEFNCNPLYSGLVLTTSITYSDNIWSYIVIAIGMTIINI